MRTSVFGFTIVAVLFALTHGAPASRAEQGVIATNTVSFAGIVWNVKASARRVGPGANYFSDSQDNVWVDETGRLHLRMTEREKKWQCAEVISTRSFGFGTYRFYLSTPLAKLDPEITLGLFTWSDAPAYAHREIDIECAKWGQVDDTNNAQFVVQPYEPPGRLLRFRIPPDLEAPILSFTWESNRISFQCLAGPTGEPISSNTVIREWTFSKRNTPQPGDENARINLWLSGGKAPVNTNSTEVIIRHFEFVPIPEMSKPAENPH